METYKLDGDPERFFRGSEIKEERVEIPDFADRLPKEIAHFTRQTVYNDKNTHLSFKQGGGHGGSHPHLVHEFVRSIIEDVPAYRMTSWERIGPALEFVPISLLCRAVRL